MGSVDAWEEYHRGNPEVYKQLCRYSRVIKKAGVSRCSIKLPLERVRWFYVVYRKDFKINNNYAGYYSRLIMAVEPDLAEMFTTRGAAFRPGLDVINRVANEMRGAHTKSLGSQAKKENNVK